MGKIIESNVNAVKSIWPDLSHMLYRNTEIIEFLRINYGNEILHAYNKLAPYAYKSDFARYCILYKISGWYLDFGLRLSGTRISIPDSISLVAFRDQPYLHTFSPFACANGAIYAKPNHPALSTAINLVLKNINEEYYGLSPLCPTGPTLWGRSIAIAGIDSSMLFGDFMELTPTHQKQNKAMVLPDGTILAFHKSSGGGDLESLGAKGTNNYNTFWHNKNIYSP